MSPRPAPDDRREHILDAASGLLAEHGTAALSVRKVAQAAGIGASTLRYYFPTNGDLMTALMKRSVDASLQDFHIEDETLDPKQRLFHCLAQFMPREQNEKTALHTWATTVLEALNPNQTQQSGQFFGTMSQHGKDHIIRWTRILENQGVRFTHSHEEMADLITATAHGLALMLLTEETMTLEKSLNLYRATIDNFFQ